MLLVLHTTSRYIAFLAVLIFGTTTAAVALVRHLVRVTPDAGEQIMACIAEQLGC